MRDIRPILTVIDGKIVHNTGVLRLSQGAAA